MEFFLNEKNYNLLKGEKLKRKKPFHWRENKKNALNDLKSN